LKDAWSNARVTLCPGTTNKYYCGDNNTACCNTSTEISILTIDGSSTSSGISPRTKGGIAVGVIGAVILAMIAVVLFVVRRKRRRARIIDTAVVDQGVQDKEGAVDMIVQPANYGHLEVSNSRPELHPFSMPWELPVGNGGLNELDVGNTRIR
jgi:hypothetical protein